MSHDLLDTVTVSDWVRNPQGRIAEHILRVGEPRIATRGGSLRAP
ncbi:MAG TPA: hypothetical protein VNF74_00675 [Terriglobales bacterium]|nr:hypothetical protein [Terriglobales bacterium]